MNDKKIKIDLHLHSPYSSTNGTKIKWTSEEEAIRILKDNNIALASFTDHNTFNFDFFTRIQNLALEYSPKVVFLPGIEVDLVRKDGKKGQSIFIFNPKQDLIKLQKHIKKIARKWMYTYQEFLDQLKDFDFLAIPHIGKGSTEDFLKQEDIESCQVDALEVTNLNHTNYKKIIKSNPNYSTVAFSDTHAWNKYPQHTKLITMIEGDPSYENLKTKLLERKNFVKQPHKESE
ncbi:PHP domain-containing protein [Mycoplasmopsis pulmonis]|nr:PHP domain-containing protein [Mycoplasmopsis pulmonis]MDZ7293682.1 PHP domain-containing protein [Mycoplasmopsis pulmonis]VEU68429.1 Uncharacterised protein [Mycoplasmopsis pulmonis]